MAGKSQIVAVMLLAAIVLWGDEVFYVETDEGGVWRCVQAPTDYWCAKNTEYLK